MDKKGAEVEKVITYLSDKQQGLSAVLTTVGKERLARKGCVMSTRHLVRKCYAVIAMFCLFGLSAPAESTVPPDGIKAEMEKRWDDAISIYKSEIGKDPSRGDLWTRIAQIEGSLGHPDKVIEAMRKACELMPNDAALQFDLASTYSAAGKPDKALESVDRALAIDPKNLKYLHARVSYANWLGRADTAAETYRRILAITPDDKKAMAGFHGALSSSSKPSDRIAFAESLEKKAALKPEDADLQLQLAQAYSQADRPDKALNAIEKAVTLKPKNVDYLLARGQYANWLGKTDIAEDSYRRIIVISPNDESAILNLARAEAWGGELDASVQSFEKYLNKRPENKEALIEYIKVQTWRGNYGTALKNLEKYKQRFGETIDYRKQAARVLASADRPAAAMEIILPLLEDIPDDYEVLYSKTIALHNARRSSEALSTLFVMEFFRPESLESKEMRQFATANIRHYLQGGAEHYTESDSIRITKYHVEGGLQLNPKIRLMGGETLHYLNADAGSGLESMDGSDPVSCRNVWAGIDYQIFPSLDLSARAGGAKADAVVDGDDDLFAYRVGADYRPADAVTLMLANGRDFYTVSPRATSLGIYKESSSLRMLWTPDLYYTVDVSGTSDAYSDGNNGWEAALAPKRSVLRSRRLNLDCGMHLWWLGFDDQPGNGYYSPAFYQRYALKADGYWKINENNGISLVFTAGNQRDNTSSTFEFGSSGDIEGQLRFYRDWMLRLHFGFTHNVNTHIGNFDARIYGIRLEKRF